ncbi:transposase [Solibacillus sp. FSL R7-0682]|uniref:transposase n=1 Tax=Solibacillus sp. FSL R7-0682 TaxID=2921690 RepID=UPI0030F7F5FE
MRFLFGSIIFVGVHWAVDEVRRKVQKEWHTYDRKKIKRIRFVLHKDAEKLNPDERWYLERYLKTSPDLKEAYELKECYKKWQRDSKVTKNITEVKAGLEAFYRNVEESGKKKFLKAIYDI